MKVETSSRYCSRKRLSTIAARKGRPAIFLVNHADRGSEPAMVVGSTVPFVAVYTSQAPLIKKSENESTRPEILSGLTIIKEVGTTGNRGRPDLDDFSNRRNRKGETTMSRVPLPTPEDAEGEVARTLEIYGKFQKRHVHSVRATANSPFLARIFYPLVQTLMREGLGTILSSKLKEIATIKTSQLNGCDY
jgi:hypothetical protein